MKFFIHRWLHRLSRLLNQHLENSFVGRAEVSEKKSEAYMV
jgi:hypothetical protein